MIDDVRRSLLLALFLFGMLGAGAELLLLEHTEDVWQLVPLSLIAVCLIVLGWRIFDRGSVSLRVFQGMMFLFVVSGFVGIFLHFKGNMEFELEMYPSLKGMPLIWKTLKGATPALAPGMMTKLGLLGLIYTFRHPAIVKPTEKNTNDKGEIE